MSSTAPEAAPPVDPEDDVLLLHAASRAAPPANATATEPPMNARRLTRCANASDARILTPPSSSCSGMSPSFRSLDELPGHGGRLVARGVGQDDAGLFRAEHVRVLWIP